MAIKGKSKPRSRKSVTPGPRPSYTPVKKPLLARPGFWFTILTVVVIASVVGIWFGLARERTNQRNQELQQRERTAAVSLQGKVLGALAGVGQAAPPANFTAFPTLTTDLDGLGKGTVTPKTAAADAAAAKKNAASAQTALDAIDPIALTANKGFDVGFVNYFFNAKEKMLDAMKLYGNVAILLDRAAAASGKGRAALLARATSIQAVASDLMNNGYSDYVQVLDQGGIFQPTFPGAPAGS